MKQDTQIQKDVMDELKWEPLLNATEIGVAVKDGAVTLTGTVDSYSKREEAENAVKRVGGVKVIALDIEVKLVGSGIKNDTEIARMIADTLKWNSDIQEDKVKIKVENGWVTLEGVVYWEYQKNVVKAAIKRLTGVKGIHNFIKVKVSPTTKNIKQKIAEAFHRSATIDSEKVDIQIFGDKAVISGTVRSWAEKEDAENATRKAPGISVVENKIIIDDEVLIY